MNYKKTVLKNGLTVVSVPLKNRPSVSVGVWVRVGGRDEPENITGISHFLEHLVFKGTTSRTMRQIKEAVEGKGGSLNAFTGSELTCFLARVPQKHLYGTLDVLCDMAVRPAMNSKELEKERTVIIEEIKMVQDNPAQHVEELLDELIWPRHALGRPLAGTVRSVSAMTRQDLVGYHAAHYTSAATTVVVAGPVEHQRLVKWCGRFFRADAPTAPAFPNDAPHERISRNFRLLKKDIEQAHMALAVRGLRRHDPDEYVLKLLNVILGGNMSSRLFNEIREERGLAYEINSFWKAHRDTGAFAIEAGVDAAKAAEALGAILEQCERLCDKPVPREELKRAKDFFRGQILMGLESSMDLMLWIGEEVVNYGRAEKVKSIERKLARVTGADIRRLARKLFQNQSLNCAVIGPLNADGEEALRRAAAFGRSAS